MKYPKITPLVLALCFLASLSQAAGSELQQAYDAYQKAFQRYTESATSPSGAADREHLLKQYREAYARYKSLKGKQANAPASKKPAPNKPAPSKLTIDTSGIDGITSISKEEVCKSRAFKQLLDEADTLRDKGDYEQSLTRYKEAFKLCPDKNIEEAMAWLMAQTPPQTERVHLPEDPTADQYRYGIGVTVDHEKAIALYQKQNNPDAWSALAAYYQEGVWLPQNQRKAKQLLQKAANAGSVAAQWQLEYLGKGK